MRLFIIDMLDKYEYKKGDICLILGDFNVDANGRSYPGKYLFDH